MRKVARVHNDPEVKRVMVYDSEDGCYAFIYSRIEDGSASADYLLRSLEEAEEMCAEDYGVKREEWTDIPDPPEGCQHDWIAPVRVVGRESGNPQWGCLERLESGVWKAIIRNPS